MRTLVACVILVAVSACASAAEYARPELLVSPAEMVAYAFKGTSFDERWSDERLAAYGFVGERPAKRFSEAGITVIDVRSAAAIAKLGRIEMTMQSGDRSFFTVHKRISNSHEMGVDVLEWKAALGDGTDAIGWSERLSAVISHPDATVIVVDVGVTPAAARVWWLLKYWGVEDARILNASEREVIETSLRSALSSSLPRQSRSPFLARPHPKRLATRAEMLGLAAGESPPTCVIDTRSKTEVGRGVIPTAAHADWVRFVDPVTGKMRSADDLAELLDEAGFVADRPAVAYCRSGGRASVVAFAMELMGGREVANYFGSWNDWTSDPTSPVARPKVLQP